jgi:hypothetical protein
MFWDVRVEKLAKRAGGRRVDEADVVWRPMHVVHLLNLQGEVGGGGGLCLGCGWAAPGRLGTLSPRVHCALASRPWPPLPSTLPAPRALWPAMPLQAPTSQAAAWPLISGTSSVAPSSRARRTASCWAAASCVAWGTTRSTRGGQGWGEWGARGGVRMGRGARQARGGCKKRGERANTVGRHPGLSSHLAGPSLAAAAHPPQLLPRAARGRGRGARAQPLCGGTRAERRRLGLQAVARRRPHAAVRVAHGGRGVHSRRVRGGGRNSLAEGTRHTCCSLPFAVLTSAGPASPHRLCRAPRPLHPGAPQPVGAPRGRACCCSATPPGRCTCGTCWTAPTSPR